MYVYIIKQSSNDYVKIGKTINDVSKRMTDLQCGCVYKLSLVYSFKCRTKLEMDGLEKDLHKYLVKYRANQGGGTEWFKIGAVGQLVRFGMSSVRNFEKGNTGYVNQKHSTIRARVAELYYFLNEYERKYYSEMESAHALERKRKSEQRRILQEKKIKIKTIKKRDKDKESLDDLYNDMRDAHTDPYRNWFKY